ncbi:MAG: hypothetical protein KKF78_11955, partial [Candidatus Omnitrophica bacterium]|nr:hypothetical protein [Candidatus Omnitrophota bacterium]MBU1997852.1 hypothetical protein [Candidatus Omnitrophota bacterium]
ITTVDGLLVTLTANQSVGDLTIGGSGRLSLSSYVLNADGNWTMSAGGVLTAGTGSVLFNASSGTKTITSNSQTFNNFTINATNGTYQPADTLDINGGFTLVDGTFDLATNDPVMHVATTFILSGGTFTKGDGTVNFDGDLTFNDAIGSVDIGNLVIDGSPETTDLASDLTATTLTINYSDQLNTNGYDLDIGGIIDINGTLDATDDVEGDRTMVAAGGDWDMTGGTFTIDNSSVTFDSVVTGNTVISDGKSFYDLLFDDGGGDSGGWSLADALITSNSFTVTASDSVDGVDLDGYDLTVGGDFVIATSGEVTAAASSITVSGNWDSFAGEFSRGSSIVTFTNDATIRAESDYNNGFASLIVNDDVDITLLRNMSMAGGVLTMGNNSTISNNSLIFWASGTGPIPFSLQTTSDLTGLNGMILYESYLNGVTLPASQFYPSTTLSESDEGTVTYIGGDVKINGNFTIQENGSGGIFDLDIDGNNLEVTGNLSLGDGVDSIGKLKNTGASTSMVTIGGNVLIRAPHHGFVNEIDATGMVLDVSGDWTNSGIFTPSTSSVTFDSTSGDQNITSGGMTFYNLVINNTDAAGATDNIVLVDALNVDNDLTITDGDLQPSGNKVNVAGQWIMNNIGTFTSGTGTVEFDDAAKVTTVYGGTTFYDLLINTASKQVDWQAGTTNTVSNAFTVDGQAGGTLVDLSSTIPDVQWTINTPTANANVQYVDLQDSESTNASITATFSLNNGNNENWIFSSLFNDAVTGRWDRGAQWGNAGNQEGVDYPGANDVAVIDGNTISLLANQSVGNITISGGQLSFDSYTLNVDGDWTFTSGVVDEGTGSVNFNATSGTKTITSGEQAFNNFTIDDSGGTATYQPVDNMDINGNFNLVDGILDLDTNDVDVKVAGNFTLTGGTYTKGAGTLNFDGDLTYTDGIGLTNIGNLIIGGSPETTDLASDLVADTLTINYSDTLNTNGYDLDIGGIIDINGTLDATDDVEGDGTTIVAGASWDMTGGTFTIAQSSVTFDSAATGNTITSDGKSFYDLVFNNGSGGWSLSDALITSNSITVTATDSVDGVNLSNQFVTVGGDFILADAGEVTAGASSITVSGNWAIPSAASFGPGTSTVCLIGSGTSFNSYGNRFYDVVLAYPGQTTTAASALYSGHKMTINGGTITGLTNYMNIASTNTDVLEIVPGSTINATMSFTARGNSVNIPGYTYSSIGFESHLGDSTFNAQGDISCLRITEWMVANGLVIFNMNGNSLGVTQDINVGTASVNNYAQFNFSTSDVTVGTDITIYPSDASGTNALTVTTGSISIGGDFINSDTFTSGTGTVNFNSTSGDQNLTSGGMTFYDLVINNTDAVSATDDIVLQDALEVDNNITITDGDLQGGSFAINVAGQWSMATAGTFTAGTSTVEFDDSSKVTTLSGNTAFYDLLIDTPSKRVDWQAGTTNTVSHAFTVDGQATGTMVDFNSTSPGTQWTINTPVANAFVNYLNVQDSVSANATMQALNSVDSLNNIFWFFGMIGGFD